MGVGFPWGPPGEGEVNPRRSPAVYGPVPLGRRLTTVGLPRAKRLPPKCAFGHHGEASAMTVVVVPPMTLPSERA